MKIILIRSINHMKDDVDAFAYLTKAPIHIRLQNLIQYSCNHKGSYPRRLSILWGLLVLQAAYHIPITIVIVRQYQGQKATLRGTTLPSQHTFHMGPNGYFQL